ncbi:hypothetical protein D3C74_328620 [compost metagenome]
MNYRNVPGHEEYDDGWIEYYHNDGDHEVFRNFSDLKEFIEMYYEDDIQENSELEELLNSEAEDFEELWEFTKDNLNDNGFFGEVFVKEQGFIASDTLFLTKKEAKRHLELNHYHYSSKAHTYAMTAWRAPKVERLINILETFDWDKYT